MAKIERGELLRKLLHMAVGGIAFAVRDLGPALAALCAVVAILFNLFVLPRIGGRRLWRSEDRERGQSLGIVLYPVAVLLLILVFWTRIEVAAAVWGILAFGDGMASLVGMTLGRGRLPWNPKKSWAGTVAYWLFGTAGAAVLLQWTTRGGYDWSFALAAAAVTALIAALIESLPQGLDDNLSVPLIAGLVLLGVLQGINGWPRFVEVPMLHSLGVAVAINVALAAVAYRLRTVNLSGAVGGFLVGTGIYWGLGPAGFGILLSFFLLGSASTKLGYKRKKAEGTAQAEGGRRGARHAIANAGVGLACALFAAATPYSFFYTLAFVAAFATAAADTMSSEIGQLWGRRTYLVTTFKPVPRGTEGAVSLEGTLAGIAGSVLVGALAAATGLFSWAWVGVVAVAAFVGTTLESLLGATLEKRGLLDNEAINFLNTLVGGLTAVGLAALILR